jgi:hypothetical protein
VNNESGLTLAELIIALGLSALLLILVVSGSLFVKKYIADWSDRDKLTEELAFITKEILPKLQDSRRLEVFSDSLWCHQSDGSTIKYRLDDGAFQKDGRPLTRAGLRVDLFEVRTNLLPNDFTLDTLNIQNQQTGLYSFRVAVSDRRGNTDTLTTVGRNRYESLKYSQE